MAELSRPNSEIKESSHKISVTQFMILLWGGILSPMIELLLPVTVKTTTYGAFLSPLLTIPFLLILAYVMRELSQGGFWICQCFCSFSGKVMLFIYGLWGIILLALRLQLCAISFRSVGYKEGSLYFLLPVVALLVLWMAGSSFGGFARASTLFFGGLLVMFITVLGLSLSEVTLSYVLPLWTMDAVPVFQATVGVLGIFGYWIYGSFFYEDVTWVSEKRINGRFWMTWCILGCFLLSLLIFVATGTFGANLLGDMSNPFYQLAKGVRVEGGFQRIESLVASILTLADFILMGVLLRGTSYTLGKLFHFYKKQWIMCGIMAISVGISLSCPYLQSVSDHVILVGNLVLGWILPLGLFFIKKVLHFPKKDDIMKVQENL